MAAYPLPDHPLTPMAVINASTAVSVTVSQGESLDWQNPTSSPIQITVSGVSPLTGPNPFTVPKTQISVGNFFNAVLATAPPGEYPFSRGATEGGGKIVVRASLAHRTNE